MKGKIIEMMKTNCQNCNEPWVTGYYVNKYECGHVVCDYCVKDGCPLCAMNEKEPS